MADGAAVAAVIAVETCVSMRVPSAVQWLFVAEKKKQE